MILEKIALILGVQALQPCSLDQFRIRESFSLQSSKQRSRLLAAFDTLSSRPPSDDWFKLQADFWARHNTTRNLAISLEWNRFFLFRAEQMLREVDSSLALPYWDWPDQSSVKKEQFGSESEECRTSPKSSLLCMARHIETTEFHAASQANSILESTRYVDLVESLVPLLPNAYYSGQEMIAYPLRPEHLLFFLYCAAIDKLWLDWQIKFPKLQRHTLASPDELLIPWEIPVKYIMDPLTRLCYTYSMLSSSCDA